MTHRDDKLDFVTLSGNPHVKGSEGESQFERILPDTLVCDPRLRCLLADERDAFSTADLKNALRDHVDHPTSICRHRNPDIPTRE